MRIYVVGGFNRDTLLGLSPKDRDFVVVGSSVEEMLSLNFNQVGKDFPIFLNKQREEFALARTERKVGVGYKGFDTDWNGVTLEEDLYRRDLSCNSIAREVDVDALLLRNELCFVGDYIDPYNGIQDIKDKVLRPISKYFSDDPVRLLRAARFLARYEGFTVSGELHKAGIELERSGELATLVAARVWKETEKVLGYKHPEKYFEFLLNFNMPFMEIFSYMSATVENNAFHQESNVFVHTTMVLSHASTNWKSPEINFATLLHDIAKPVCYAERGNGHGHDKEGVSMIEDWCVKWKVPNNYKDLALITCAQHQRVHSVFGRGSNDRVKPKSIMKMFTETSAITKPERFGKMLKACESDSFGRISDSITTSYPQRPYLLECLEAVRKVNTKKISSEALARGVKGVYIGERIRVARIDAIRTVYNKWKQEKL